MSYTKHELALEVELRALPVETPEQARHYLERFDLYRVTANPYGRPLTANWKPSSVRAGDLFVKASRATETAGQCYWQMPYDEAAQRFYGLPRATWAKARRDRGLSLDPEVPA